jgi:predicted outer membrane repeat protein
MLRKLAAFALLSLLLTTALIAGQPAGGDFVISNSTIDNGGGVSAGGNFMLTGTIGQPDANAQFSSGDNYQLAGGFWTRLPDADLIFNDSFESED